MRISDWSSDVCSSDLRFVILPRAASHPSGDSPRFTFTLRVRSPLPSSARSARIRLPLPPPSQSLVSLTAFSSPHFVHRGCHIRRDVGQRDRKSVGEGKRVSVRVAIGGRRNMKKKSQTRINQ